MKALVLVLAVTACYRPDVGDAFTATVDAGPNTDGGPTDGAIIGCDNSDSDPAVTVSFANDIRPLMTRAPGGCATCHLGRAVSGLDLSSYPSLRRGGSNSGTRIIVANEPCNSILVQKVGRTPPFGSRMPYNGPPYFTAAELQLVRDWVAEGAQNN